MNDDFIGSDLYFNWLLNTLKYLDMTAEEYSPFLFDLGVQFQETYRPAESEALKKSYYWDYFEFLFLNAMNNHLERIEKGKVLDKNKFTLFKNLAIEQIAWDLKYTDPLKLKNTEATRNKNNQLNTI